MKKENWTWLLFLVLRFFIAHSQDQSISMWSNIDCGNDAVLVDGRFIWGTDVLFTQSGVNKRINSTIQVPEEMNTLRFFPDGTQKNCYALPILSSQRHLIRAGFYYNNYDGLSNPPTFDLYLDEKKWSTVDTSISTMPIYYEAVHKPRGLGFITLCLVQTRKEDVPFVSSIEVVPLPSSFYSQMEDDYSYILVSRTNLGGGEIRYTGLVSDERYNRVWARGESPLNCVNVSTLPDASSIPENAPPFGVMGDSIQSRIAADPIILSADLPQGTPPQQPAYFVFYFNEAFSLTGSTRTVRIYVDGQMKSTVNTSYGRCKVVTINAVTVAGPTVNVTLGTVNGSTLPAIISGLEVFMRGESYGQGQDQGRGTNLACTAGNNFLSAFVMLIYFLWFIFS